MAFYWLYSSTLYIAKNIQLNWLLNKPVLKGHGPFRDDNYLQMSGKKLILSYHGGFNQFTKVAK